MWFTLQVVGDITKDSTLLPEYFKGVKKVINAASVIVGPKEGDTPDRAKYSQVRIIFLCIVLQVCNHFKTMLSSIPLILSYLLFVVYCCQKLTNFFCISKFSILYHI